MSMYGPVLDKGLIEYLEPYWDKIRRKAAQSIKRSARNFIPPLEEDNKVLGCGAWGCVWPTSDKKFVLKCSLDANEGPAVAQVISSRKLRFNKGVAYFRGVWQLPDIVWVDELGYTPLWIILREEVSCSKCWTAAGNPVPKLKKVARILESVPDFSEELTELCCQVTIDPDDSAVGRDCGDAEDEFLDLLKGLKGTPGRYVGDFIEQAWKIKKLIMGDVHFGNVGFRTHDLSSYGVPRHRLLVATDIGDQEQPTPEEGTYPKVKAIRKNPDHLDYWTKQIPSV